MSTNPEGQYDSDNALDDDAAIPHNRQTRKRTSRACDQCRKCKSKCERIPGAADGTPCKICSLAGTACTSLGPSYKRGPPKGYIHAIEQRWHQVESLLGVLLQSSDPRVQSVMADLKQDDLAREILSRVDLGPYGPMGRMQSENSTKEDFFASILRSNQPTTPHDSSRAKRQSRVSREIVSSSHDRGLSITPTKEWQNTLVGYLDSSSSKPSSPTFSQPSSSNYDSFGAPLSQRRRLNTPNYVQNPQWDNLPMYTMDDSEDRDSIQDPTEALGELSLDERQELRFHGRSSGLHLINTRIDDRNEGGIWRLPMARVWPLSKATARLSVEEEDITVALPPSHIQEDLLQLYFTYIHPNYPVVNQSRFMTEYQIFKNSGFISTKGSPEPGASPRPESTQPVTRLLLLSMFALAARYRPDEAPPPPEGSMWEGGCNYMDGAISILTKIFHRSRPSTVQALLLLGYREFGIGSMEQAWIYIGMGIRMALDLGLNCDSGSWKMGGRQLFPAEETQTRRQIWWTCTLADRYGSTYMGRPVTIKDSDADVQLPSADVEEELHPWQPVPTHRAIPTFNPVPSHIMSAFSAVSLLSLISGDIITVIYPVRPTPGTSRRVKLEDFERRLDRWYLILPEHLRYDVLSQRGQIPPPHILMLHVRYWGTVLLLHRAFIPNWNGQQPPPNSTTREFRVFDLAQTAASRLTAIVTAWRETFTMRYAPPFLTSYLLNAGAMHIVTLTIWPDNPQAAYGLEQCMLSLADMKITWPSAARAWDLLKGVKIETTAPSPSTQTSGNRPSQKRQADDAFGQDFDLSMSYDARNPSGGHAVQQPVLQSMPQPAGGGIQDLNSRIMAQMLGLDIPNVQQSTSPSFIPGNEYEWWPPSSANLMTHQRSPVTPESPAGAPIGSVPNWLSVPQGSQSFQNNNSFSHYGG